MNQTPQGSVRLTRYADCVRLLRDLPVGVRHSNGWLPEPEPADRWRNEFLFVQDPPSHTRIRRLMSHAFTARHCAAVEPFVQELVNDCLDRVAPSGRMDVVTDLALPVPASVICRLLGIEDQDHVRLTDWTSAVSHQFARSLMTPELLHSARAAASELSRFLEDLIERRRRRPREDVVSVLVAAADDGDQLRPRELVSQLIGLLIGGFETTMGLIANGIRALIAHPEQLARLRARPDLARSAVEECLRYAGPVLMTSRIVHADVVFHGETIPKDTQVWAVLFAAHRDPRRFPDPDRFDVGRAPNPHLAFGGGIHACLGANLARMEARHAILGLINRFDSLELESEAVELRQSLFHVPAQLPIRFVPRASALTGYGPAAGRSRADSRMGLSGSTTR